MTHLNPEIVADRLIELGVNQDEFITALATPSKNKELAKLANEVLEKIRGQRNPNSYGAKFITELREHLKHHKDSCGSPALEESVKKYVTNPSSYEENPNFDQKGHVLEDIEDYAQKALNHLEATVRAGEENNFKATKHSFKAFSMMFGLMSKELKSFSRMVMFFYFDSVAIYTVVVEEYLKNDRFDLEALIELKKALKLFHEAIESTMNQKGISK